jgi:hypothetical protein
MRENLPSMPSGVEDRPLAARILKASGGDFFACCNYKHDQKSIRRDAEPTANAPGKIKSTARVAKSCKITTRAGGNKAVSPR